jgi:hypothetical protein
MTRATVRLAVSVVFLVAAASAGVAGGRTVVGTVSAVDAAEGTLTVRDAAGVSWSYRVDRDAGIDLKDLRAGDRVEVTIGRPTPLNMISAADRLREGDRVRKIGY